MEILLLLAVPAAFAGSYLGAWLNKSSLTVTMADEDVGSISHKPVEGVEWGTKEYQDIIGSQLEYWRRQSRNNRAKMEE